MSETPCWADPLTREERYQLRRILLRGCRAAASDPAALRRRRLRTAARRRLALSLASVSGEIADLHLDVKERAAVAAS